MVNLIKNKATSGNVSALRIQSEQSPLPDNVADVVLCILVMHYKETTDDRYKLVKDISRITKPGGRIFIVQWDTSERNESVHGISYEETLALLTGHKLQAEQKKKFADGQYSILSTKLIDPN
jgi:ubiquinone/menaquinone biosynthesis C-methylase UbiE